VPFHQVRQRGLVLDVSLVSSASVDPGGSAPHPRTDALKHWHAEKMRTPATAYDVCGRAPRGLHVRRAARRLPPFSAHQAGVDVDGAGAVMGSRPPQMRGAVLGSLKAEFLPSCDEGWAPACV